ncbi:MAG TPA: hypothetical protein VEK11_16360 [Thermoanaerobaculia bacterium]|nr:hypothetical protein [Thermoanaerobaculia bacterium]
MRGKLVLATLLLVVAAVPAFAQNYQYCIGSGPYFTCEYLWDTPLSEGTTYWGYTSGSGTLSVSNPCAGGTSTDAADLDPGHVMAQGVTMDDWPVVRMEFEIYKTSTSVTANDSFTVEIYDYSTFAVEESHTFYANATSSLCIPVDFALDNTYANSTIQVRIKKSSSATATMYVDNVTLWGRNN